MGINIGRGGYIAVPEPFLNVLQRHAVCVQQRRAAVPKIVKTDLTQSMLLQKLREYLRQIVRLHQFAHLVDIDILQIVPAIGLEKGYGMEY